MLAAGCALALLAPQGAWGQERPNHLSAGLGYYFYTGDTEDQTNLDGAVNVEVAYTRTFRPNFALRGTVGYFHDGRRDDDLRGYPVSLTALAVLPRGRAQLFAGGGVSVFPVDYEGRIDGVPVSDTDTSWGGHVLVGATVDVWSWLVLGLEAKYLFLEKASFGGRELDLEGVVVSTTLGVRF